MKRITFALTIWLGVTPSACGGSAGKPDGATDATAPTDSSLDDEATLDGSVDADTGFDAGPATYNDITNSNNWQLFANPSSSGGFASPAFDGKYIYYSPFYGGTYVHGKALRFDTTGSFQNSLSWSSFDFTQLNSKAKGYFGTVFDGRYIYFTPMISDSGPVINTLVIRFDTQASFTSGAAWSLFDLGGVDAKAGGYGGAAFDGRYLYLAPYIMTGSPPSLAIRYDTKAAFTSGASWQKFDTTTKDMAANTYYGAVFDGRYVYYVPGPSGGGVVARFDTQGSFKDGNAWTLCNLPVLVNPASKDFVGGTFDGRFVYFIPWQLGDGGIVTRYDTQVAFTTKSAWQTFDLANWKASAAGFQGAVFDGQYVYLVPANHNLIVRYDTQSSFTSAASFTTFDLGAYTKQNSATFLGAGFDGEFLYLAPATTNTPMVRFDAKTPPSLPAAYHGSFF